MSITITCPCGKGYTKPEFKAGTLFRCHMCGRELTITEAPTSDGVIAFAPETAKAAVEKPDVGSAVEARAKSTRPRPPRGRGPANIIAWLLIVLGFAGILGGIAMIYMFSVLNKAAQESANARARLDPFSMPAGPPRQNELIKQYGSAGASIVVGGVLLTWGFGIKGKNAA